MSTYFDLIMIPLQILMVFFTIIIFAFLFWDFASKKETKS